MSDAPDARIVIVGTGFSGLGMAIRLKQEGVNDFVILERAGEVGGTWQANSYPGCQCDVPSNLYSFSFAPNPEWTRMFSRQPEIQAYLRRCAEEHGLLEHIRFGHEVAAAAWDEDAGLWRLQTPAGEVRAPLVVSGIGGLSEPAIPDLPGLDGFQGARFHSAQWDHDHDLAGKRVAVIGTGASSIQFVPRIQPQVGSLHLFQRTPPWILPHPDRPTLGAERALFRRFPAVQRLVRSITYGVLEVFTYNLVRRGPLLKVLQGRARWNIRRQVEDPDLRRRLTPDYEFGCKRFLMSNTYYRALDAPNAELVTDGIKEVREHSIVTADGTEREVDTIILGTGFHVTDVSAAQHIRGRGGRTLRDVWGLSPQAYVGTTIAGFPNWFMLLGPNTGLGSTSIVLMIESQIAYVMDALREMDRRNLDVVDVRPEVVTEFNQRLQADMKGTVWMDGGCASWYIDAAGRNTTLWPDATWRYRRRTRRFDPAEYDVQTRPAPAPAELIPA